VRASVIQIVFCGFQQCLGTYVRWCALKRANTRGNTKRKNSDQLGMDKAKGRKPGDGVDRGVFHFFLPCCDCGPPDPGCDCFCSMAPGCDC
jgi:hypothetical protein